MSLAYRQHFLLQKTLLYSVGRENSPISVDDLLRLTCTPALTNLKRLGLTSQSGITNVWLLKGHCVLNLPSKGLGTSVRKCIPESRFYTPQPSRLPHPGELSARAGGQRIPKTRAASAARAPVCEEEGRWRAGNMRICTALSLIRSWQLGQVGSCEKRCCM